MIVSNKYLNHKPLQYGKKFYFSEFLAERIIQIIAILSIGFIIAIFYYVFQEATYAFVDPEKNSQQVVDNKENQLENSELQDTNSTTDETSQEKDKPESYSPDPVETKPSKSITKSENTSDLKPETYKPESYSPDPVETKLTKSKTKSESTSDLKPEINKPESYTPDADVSENKSKTSDKSKLKSVETSELKPETYSPETENSKSDKKNKAHILEKKNQENEPIITDNINIEEEDTNSNSTSVIPEQISQNPDSDSPEQKVTIKKLFTSNDYIDDKPQYVWQPISNIPKYSLIPLFVGALKVTLIGLLIAAPIAILAAIFTVAFAPRWMREIIKPAIEILAGFPSVVIGFFCLLTLATVLQDIFDTTFRLNSFVGGIGMALAVIPIIFTVTEDALSAVPKFMKEASLALGASRWQTAIRVTLPAAAPGVFAAIILGFGRAFGETMIALMATGNAALVSGDIFESVRTMAATIGAEMAEVEFHSIHYGVLFLIGAILFVITFSLNAIAEFYVRKRLMKKFQGL